MFELPEIVTLSKQINQVMRGKTVRIGHLGNTPHKFVWYNRSPEEFERLTEGRSVGVTSSKGNWLFIPLEPGYVLLLGEFGGKALYHQPGSKLPKKYHLHLIFDDDSFFTVTTQMWGAMELYEQGEETKRRYIHGMRITPVEPAFTFEYFCELIEELTSEKKRSTKALLTQDQSVPGVGNAIAQDIMFHAGLHPRHPLDELTWRQTRQLYEAIRTTIDEVISQGARYDEFDLHNNRGGYIRLMDKNSHGQPCPQCGTEIEKFSYLGGTCYICPGCQI
jgi:formamidopyrimidine-DNA glycosylase